MKTTCTWTITGPLAPVNLVEASVLLKMVEDRSGVFLLAHAQRKNDVTLPRVWLAYHVAALDLYPFFL